MNGIKRLILISVGIAAGTLGGHGIYVYFNPLLTFWGNVDTSKLFLAIGVPLKIQPIIEWATIMGMGSWVIPALLLGAGAWFLKLGVDD